MEQELRERLQVKLREWSLGMPFQDELFNGMKHMNDEAKLKDQRWHPVRAIASAKLHFLPKIRKVLDERGAGANLQGATVKFAERYPDTSPASGGRYPLTEAGWQALKDSGMGIKSDADFIKHLLTLHDGEAKIVGDFTWHWLTDSVVEDIKFHNCQFATTREVRSYLHWRSQEDHADDDLTGNELKWIMEEEINETLLLKWSYDDGYKADDADSPFPASGGRYAGCKGCFLIKAGRCITLAELFWNGMEVATCYDLYRLYLSLLPFIHKRYHPVSHTEEATLVRNLPTCAPNVMEWRAYESKVRFVLWFRVMIDFVSSGLGFVL